MVRGAYPRGVLKRARELLLSRSGSPAEPLDRLDLLHDLSRKVPGRGVNRNNRNRDSLSSLVDEPLNSPMRSATRPTLEESACWRSYSTWRSAIPGFHGIREKTAWARSSPARRRMIRRRAPETGIPFGIPGLSFQTVKKRAFRASRRRVPAGHRPRRARPGRRPRSRRAPSSRRRRSLCRPWRRRLRPPTSC